jgi:hypothetical protein
MMKFTTAFFLLPVIHGFTLPSKIGRYPSHLSVSQSESKTSSQDLAKDFDDITPEDVTPSEGGAKAGQAEVVLVGCGAPNRGMGWYHAVQMLEGR